jgi:glycosyltransferase involved in cell wall biosynthesis
VNGRLRLSGTKDNLFIDLDPGEAEKPVIGLDMIARSDADGLERAILSALPEVDEIVIGVDGRSDEATLRVAEAYADAVWRFAAEDIGLSAEEWRADRIAFGAARNLGRARLRAPWALVLDTDEYIARTVDLRAAVQADSALGKLDVIVHSGQFEQRDAQRVARSAYRWAGHTHNVLLAYSGKCVPVDTFIVHDLSLRAPNEIARRASQRDGGIAALGADAARGELIAMFHVAKHKLGRDGEEGLEGVRLAQEYRFRAEPHGPFAAERAVLAVGAAVVFYKRDNLVEAELWALRAMLDGPCLEALCLLGDIAEDSGDLQRALAWYEAACAVPESRDMKWHKLVDQRQARREELRHALASAA